MTLQDLINHGMHVTHDDAKLNTTVHFSGFGWYSLNDSKEYIKGRPATTSRIIIAENETEARKFGRSFSEALAEAGW